MKCLASELLRYIYIYIYIYISNVLIKPTHSITGTQSWFDLAPTVQSVPSADCKEKSFGNYLKVGLSKGENLRQSGGNGGDAVQNAEGLPYIRGVGVMTYFVVLLFH